MPREKTKKDKAPKIDNDGRKKASDYLSTDEQLANWGNKAIFQENYFYSNVNCKKLNYHIHPDYD